MYGSQYANAIRRNRKELEAMGITPGMSASGYQESVPDLAVYEKAAKDLSGEERRIDAMRDYAQAMRGTPMPQGKTVGPSNIYVGPNWGEMLSYAAQQVMGGHMAGKAREQDEALDAQRAAQTAAQAGLARARDMDDRSRWEREFTLDQDQFTADQAQNAADLAQEVASGSIEMVRLDDDGKIAETRMAAPSADGFLWTSNGEPVDEENWRTMDNYLYTMAGGRGRRGGSGSVNEPKRYIDPVTGDERMLAWNKAGNYIDAATGERVEPDSISGWVPESAMSEGQRERAVGKFIENNKDVLSLMHDIEAAEATWYANGWDGQEPLFNWFTKQTGALGDAFRLMSDIGEEGAPSQDDFAAAQTTINTISRLRAGLSQTENELRRIQTETGQDALASPQVFIKYWGRLRDKVGNDIRLANKSVSPRTLQAYNRWEGQKRAADIAPETGLKETTSRGGPSMAAEQKTLADYTDEELDNLSEEELRRLLEQ